MNRRSILTKTGKGLMEATGKTSNLSRDLRNILKEIDGKVSVSELLEKFGRMPEPRLLEALVSMEREGYVREFVGKQDDAPRAPTGRTPIAPSSTDSGEDLDFTAFTPAKPSAKTGEDSRLQAQAQEIARQAQATRAREEAAAKVKAEATARAKAEAEQKARLSTHADPKADQARAQAEALDQARREAEERQRREAEEKARREAEARARIDSEQGAKREAEERARQEIREKERRESEEKARREAEVRARLEAEEKVRRDTEDRARREAEERARQEVEEQMRREEAERRKREDQEQAERRVSLEAEARAKVEAEMRARREAEERARREEDERPRREEELRRRTEEEVRKRREAEDTEHLERSLREQEEKERREAEQREREEEQRREEEERARREAEEEAQRTEEEEEQRAKEGEQRAKEGERRAREEEKTQAKKAKKAAKTRNAARAKERAGEEAWRGDDEAARSPGETSLSAREIWAKRKPGSLAKQFAVMLLVILIVALAALPFVPLEPGSYEKAAQAWLGEPVKIGTVNLTLLPMPQLKFEKVVIGKEHPVRVAQIKATPVVTSLLEDRISIKSFELENANFPKEFLPVLLQNKGGRGSFGVQRITAKGLKLDIPELNLPALEVDAQLSSDGALQSVAFFSAERKLSVKLQPQGGRAAIEISADSFPLPLGMELAFSEFLAKGTVTRNELALSEAEVRAFGGRLLGNARLRWSDGWSLEGDLAVRQMDAAKIAAPLLAGGTLEGKGTYSMKALLPERLLLNLRLEGNFTVQKGSITNVDMTRVLQGSGSGGGTTLFSDMSGSVSVDPNRILVRQIRMAAGLLNSAGQVEMDPQKNLSGRMQIELRAQSVQARATLTVGGTLQNPQFRRSN
jgi:hypothetical protein